jgi:hypothetical protein
MAEEIVVNIKSNVGEVAGGLDKAAKSTEKLSKASKKAGGGFKKLGTVVKGVGMALKAAGIGLIVALVAKLMEVFGSNQKVLDAFDTGMTALTMAFNDLFKAIEGMVGPIQKSFKAIFEDPQQALKDFGDMIEENIIERFESLLDTFGYVGDALGALFAGEWKKAGEFAVKAGKEMVDVQTGINNSVDKMGEVITKGAAAIVDYTKKTLKAAGAVTATKKAAQKAAVEFEKLNAQYMKDAEIQRQIRDDETKTFEERIAANKELDKILADQQAAQKAQLAIQQDAAQLQYDITKNDADWIELEKTKVALLQLEEAITGQLSEQKTNQVGLERELLEAQNELALTGKTNRELELAELQQAYEAKLELARKANVGTAEIDAEFAVQKDEINRAYDEAELAKAQELADKKKAVMQGMLDNISSILTSALDAQGAKNEKNYNQEKKLAEANGKSTEGIEAKYEAKRVALAKKQKALKIGLATIDMYQSAVAAYAAGLQLGAPGLVIAPIAAGLAVVAGLANINSIMQTDVGGGGGGGGASAPGAAGGGAPAPQMMSGEFQLGGGVEPEAMKAYVVTDEMSNSQNQLANIRRRATI